MIENPHKKYKLIKVYYVEDRESKNKMEIIKQKITQFMNWYSIEKSQIQDHFLMFPNESVYKQGVRVSYKSRKKLYQLQLIKSKVQNVLRDCFCYEYQKAIFYDDPIPILKKIGYNQTRRRSKHAIIFKSLKYGLEVILYHPQKQDNLDEVKKGKLQIIQMDKQSIFIQQIQFMLKDLIKCPLENDLRHDVMTLKNIGSAIEIIEPIE